MKFILNEAKFILNEDKRFLLDERFILNEATMAQVAAQWTNKLKATFKNTKEVLAKYIEFAGLSAGNAAKHEKFKKIKIEIEQAAKELETSLELPFSAIAKDGFKDIKNELADYMTALILIQEEEVLKGTDESDLLEKRINELSQIYNKTEDWTTTDFENIKKAFKFVTEKILPVFDVSDLDKNAKDVEAFKKSCQECTELIKELEENLPNDLTKFSDSDLQEYKKALEQADNTTAGLKDAKSINKGLVISNLATYQKQVEAIKTTYTAVINTKLLSKTVAAVINSSKEDWKVNYEKAVNKEAVIEEFIYTTWKDKANNVLKIKKAFEQECISYGFRPSNNEGKNGNPFINFISETYLEYNFSSDVYNIIHNLVAGGTIKGEDLVGSGKLKKNNLLFCKALYALDPSVIKVYLKKQTTLLNTKNKPDDFETVSEMVFNILYKLPEVVTGDKFKNINSSKELSLNTLNTIEELEAQWTGSVTEIPADDKEVTNKIASNAELLKAIDTTENAVNVLVTLALKFSTDEKISALVNTCAEATNLMKSTKSLTDMQKLMAKTERAYKIEKINATQALSLIKSILEADQFKLTKA